MEAAMRARILLVTLVALAAAPSREADAKWAGGIILLPSLDASVDGEYLASGPLVGDEVVQTGDGEARIYVRGPAGQALVVMAPATMITLSGSLAAGFTLDLEAGAIRLVIKGSEDSLPVIVRASGKTVDMVAPGGVVVVDGATGTSVLALGSAEALALFPQDAASQAKGLGMPPTGLPLVGAVQGSVNGDGASLSGGSAEVEGESKCIDAASAGPEGTNPSTDGTDPTQIDRTRTRVHVKVQW
jgi:hypothetical protein